MPKFQHRKAGTLKCKTLVLVDSNKSHPYQTMEVIEREDLAVIRTVPCIISHFCWFTCISTEVSEAHRMIFQVINYLWDLHSVQSPKIKICVKDNSGASDLLWRDVYVPICNCWLMEKQSLSFWFRIWLRSTVSYTLAYLWDIQHK